MEGRGGNLEGEPEEGLEGGSGQGEGNRRSERKRCVSEQRKQLSCPNV